MEYTYFTFDGVPSSKYNVYIQNTGEDLSYPSQPGFENQIVSPLFQGTSYLAGVNKTQREFTFNCWADSLSLSTMRELLNWVSVDKISTLVLDYNPNFEHTVKVSTISEMKHMALNEDGTSNYEFTISFVTIGSPLAKSIQTGTFNQTVFSSANLPFGNNNDNGAPFGFNDNGIVKVFNYYTANFPLRISINSATSLNVALNSSFIYKYTSNSAQNFDINSETGIVKIGNNLAESVSGIAVVENDGIMNIPSGDSKTLITSNYAAETTNLLINDENNIINYANSQDLYIIVQDGSYGNESTPIVPVVDRENYILNKINKDGSNSNIDMLNFNTTTMSTTALSPGQMRWNDHYKTIDIGLRNGTVLQSGQETNIWVYNKEAFDLPDGTPVYIEGAQDDGYGTKLLSVKKGSAANIASAYIVGFTTNLIPSHGFGYITTFGFIHDISTSDFDEGSPLWLTETGAISTTQPAPQYAQSFLGWCAKKGGVGVGSIYVFPVLLQRALETPIIDSGNYYTGTNIESALQEVGKRIQTSAAAPTTGTWAKGDIMYNNSPDSGEYIGWVCTVAGTPGTWKGFGLIA